MSANKRDKSILKYRLFSKSNVWDEKIALEPLNYESQK